MALKTYKPTSPGRRQLVLVDRRELYKGRPVKALTEGKRGTGGRNNHGRITLRWRGFRPHVRGEAMNPVDHPLGGRTRGGRHPVSPWGQPTKGKKTRQNKATDRFIVRRRFQK